MSSTARLEGHQNGLQAMRSGDYAQAVEAFSATLSAYGPHVALLADLAGAHYLAGDMGRFAAAVERLEANFVIAQGTLSRESQIRTHICLSKYAEELGRIADAFDHIEAALHAIEPGSQLAIQTRCQKLRLLATYGRESEVAELYRSCLSVSEDPVDLRLECFHALCLAEARLFGVAAAWPRFESVAKSTDRQAADLRLCAIDLLEIAIETADVTAQARLMEFLRDENLDPYEKQMVRLALGESIGPEDLFNWSRALAPQAFLRLLALAVLQSLEGDVRQTLLSRFHFLLQSFDHRTRKLLRAKWARFAEAVESVELRLNLGKTVVCGDKVLALSSSPQSWLVLEALCEGVRVPADLLGRLAKRGESLENLESLRLLLLRLNKKLSAIAGVDWVVKYRKDGLLIQDSVVFRRGDA